MTPRPPKRRKQLSLALFTVNICLYMLFKMFVRRGLPPPISSQIKKCLNLSERGGVGGQGLLGIFPKYFRIFSLTLPFTLYFYRKMIFPMILSLSFVKEKEMFGKTLIKEDPILHLTSLL